MKMCKEETANLSKLLSIAAFWIVDCVAQPVTVCHDEQLPSHIILPLIPATPAPSPTASREGAISIPDRVSVGD
jgi:hypothetical protein